MNDILSHTTTFALGLLVFFAALHELVITFRRKKEEFVTAKSPPWGIKGDGVAFTASEDLFNSPEGKKMLEYVQLEEQKRIDAALQSGTIYPPLGMNREQMREFIIESAEDLELNAHLMDETQEVRKQIRTKLQAQTTNTRSF